MCHNLVGVVILMLIFFAQGSILVVEKLLKRGVNPMYILVGETTYF